MASPMQFKAQRVTISDSLEEICEYLHSHRMTDGLPVIPPTEERVARMVEASGRPPSDVVAKMAPVQAPVTIEKIAISAVMAGCLPSYMPVLIAAVDALCDPAFNLHGVQSTTNSVGPVLVLNGPIRAKLGIQCGSGLLGPGFRANASIGRAVRLLLINVGDAAPGAADRATMGWPGKYTCCIGEYEESNPWEPYHVEKGFKAEQSTVSVFGCDGSNQISDLTPYPQQNLEVLGRGLVRMPMGFAAQPAGDPSFQCVLLVNPAFAGGLAGMGLTKKALKQRLWELAKVPSSWIPKTHTWVKLEPDGVPIVATPDDIHLFVAGGEDGYHNTVMHTIIAKPVIRAIKDA